MSTFVKARCHCGLNVLNIKFSTSSLPLPSIICHCNSCRHSTGQMARNYIPFEGEPTSFLTNKPIDFENLTGYHTSPSTTRWFCNICSTHLIASSTEIKVWYVAVGALERAGGIVQFTGHIWVSDTLDGGTADHLSVFDERKIPRYSEFPVVEGGTLPLGWRGVTENPSPDQLSAYCHCRAISFSITRPSLESKLPSSPYPDFLFPHDTTPITHLGNPDNEKWWLRPVDSENPTHYLAGYCACSTCRLVTGSEVQCWAFVPRSNIIFHGGTPDGLPVEIDLVDEDKRPKHLKRYDSSPTRHREYCDRCGATVFFWTDIRRDLIAISTGLFNERQDGSRAEGWLDWHLERVGFSEQASRKSMVDAIVSHK
ncbi:Mss4-like protein [Collybia nuda]|uniref:Mss4-like protein n=1 Tax=Collybia nuda TaxID=64659 RepID=A0A9P6CG68_9AGAR|nr:Mss4-like protein [Collybia nuda]